MPAVRGNSPAAEGPYCPMRLRSRISPEASTKISQISFRSLTFRSARTPVKVALPLCLGLAGSGSTGGRIVARELCANQAIHFVGENGRDFMPVTDAQAVTKAGECSHLPFPDRDPTDIRCRRCLLDFNGPGAPLTFIGETLPRALPVAYALRGRHQAVPPTGVKRDLYGGSLCIPIAQRTHLPKLNKAPMGPK